MADTEKTIRDAQVDKAILKMKKEFIKSGIKGEQLYIAVARAYANAVMITFQQKYNIIKKV